jgi:hypothetical protein
MPSYGFNEGSSFFYRGKIVESYQLSVVSHQSSVFSCDYLNTLIFHKLFHIINFDNSLQFFIFAN